MVGMAKIQKFLNKKLFLILIILLVGIFLRTYHFHDWLRFNADQGRDAELVSRVLSGQETWPLLGPKAGGTEFKLGPAFYYLEIISAKIFGNYPDKMAFPDLFSGIASISLLYFLLRKYFDQNIALATSALYAVSNYAVRYSRFAWNPNSTPFWTMLALYAISEVISVKQQRKYLWAMVAGAAIGIGMQLHTTLMIILPITTVVIFGFLAIKNLKVLKHFAVILALALFMNVPQFIHEYQYNGENARAFFAGAQKKQESVSLIKKVWYSSSCLIQANADIISGWEISDTCSFKPEKNKDDLAVFIFSAIFLIGGLLLAIKSLRREKDVDKKNFLIVIMTFLTVTLLLFIPIAFELSVRFYLILIFLPYLLLGFWFQFLKEKFARKSSNVAIVIFTVLVFSNIIFVKKAFDEQASYANKGGTVDIVLLSQLEDFVKFIVDNSKGSDLEIVDGNKKFLFKAFKPMNYLAGLAGLKLHRLEINDPAPKRYFYIARGDKRKALLNDKTVIIKASRTHGGFTILLLEAR